jgi:sugar transferase EpsL
MKRLFDILLAGAALMLLAPLLACIALAVAIALGRPVLFRQQRPGRNGELFEMLKFRTMLGGTMPDGTPLPDAQRLTRFGRWLRSTSLDELPGLWSVLRGDMSLVGPRPLLVEYLPLYNARQARRHEVRPGLTGWAQVNGRNALSWDEKFELDIWYVDNRSFLLDLRILLLTIKKVLLRHGITASNDVTMPRFLGNGER